MLLDSDVDPEKVHSIGSELKNLIKSIEWDLEDLDQTISILSLVSIQPLSVSCVMDWYMASVCVCVCVRPSLSILFNKEWTVHMVMDVYV